MAQAVKLEQPPLIKGVYGKIVSHDPENHLCTFRLEQRRQRIGLGVLDTTHLERMLEGASDLGLFLSTSAGYMTKITPLTDKRAEELNWSRGQYEVRFIYPTGLKRDVNRIPGNFVDKASRKVLPSAAYCQQPLVAPRGFPRASAKATADVISGFRKFLKTWEVFPLKEVLNVLGARDGSSDLAEYFGSYRDVATFVGSLPQYFTLTADRKALGFSYRFSEEDYKAFLRKQSVGKQRRGAPPPYVLVEDVLECQRQVRRLLRRARGSDQLILAVDCEGVNLGKEGPLTLLQIGTVEGEVFVFDVLATPNPKDMFIEGGLKALLEEPAILKVMHDCRGDQCALYFQFDVTLDNVFDTSVAYTTIWEQCNVLGGPMRPKLALLIEIYGMTAEHKTDAFAEAMHDGKLFGKRPLTEDLIEYAIDDVLCLIPTIYENMNRLISPLWRPHFRRKVECALSESRLSDPHRR